MLTPEQIIAELGLRPLPVEGGFWAQTWRTENGTGIYYLMSGGGFSALHRLKHPEVFSYHAGSPARMLLLHPGGRVEQPVLGLDLAAGQRPQVVVPAGVWQASEPIGDWSLLGTFMAPPYTDDVIDFPSGDELLVAYPEFAEEIRRLSPQE
ncbi:cupin domain-containing protein [Crossiella cryophila]|uniref:Putative cupin superfamily sugar epimerase n=1 Tax=Crossiella cryophila TaxID=43355 RepID=A0A7W7CBA0_9PSEU|nr:cupin domain-containing protein [Crossiella cryophila]MBB4677981.1 putative cupin superfamily sugar epimerase [Crossiella cryophila]